MFSFARIAKEFGWTHKEILQLTVRQFFLYLRNIDKLEAHRQSLAFEAASFPQMKKNDQKKARQHYLTIAEGERSTRQQRVDGAWSELKLRGTPGGRRRPNSTSKT